MAMQHAPPHLTVTKAFLTDNPYENQLGLLRWIRKFLSEVVDAAASQSESDQHRRQEEQKEEKEEELAVDACKEDDQEQGCALGAPTQEEKREEHSTSGAISKSASTEEALEESRPCVEGVEADTVAPSNSIITEGCKESGTAASAGGRKRPRNLLHGQDLFGVGSVVECFHPDDGLWYPATITAVVPPPPPKTASSDLPLPTHSLDSDGAEGAIAATAPAEGGALPLPDPDSNTTTSAAAEPLASASLESIAEAVRPGSGCEAQHEGEHEGGHERQHEGQHERQHEGLHDEGQHELLPALDVTFLGYGNTSTVPYLWTREIVTPEVLQW
ncbi:unnamed protein product, partial [Laminaria digitata]